MLIRCEKCSTLYELDDRLLPPQGAPVQCSKCQFVFKAYPAPPAQRGALEQAANDAPTEVAEAPAEVEPPRVEPPRPRREDFVREGGALANSFDDLPPAPPVASPRSGVPGGAPGEASGGSSHPDDGPRFTADGRPIRKVPFPVGESPQQGPRTPPLRPAAPKRGAGRPLPRKWVIVAIVVVVLLVIAVLAWRGAGDGGSAPPGQSQALPQGGTAAPPPRK